MDHERIYSILDKYIESIVSERDYHLEETKKQAFSLWHFISLMGALKPKTITVRQNHDGKILIITDDNKTYFSRTCSDQELLKLVTLIAENSDVKGKIFSSQGKNYRELAFHFK